MREVERELEKKKEEMTRSLKDEIARLKKEIEDKQLTLEIKSLSVNKKCVIIVQVRKVSKDEKKYRKKEILSLLDAIG